MCTMRVQLLEFTSVILQLPKALQHAIRDFNQSSITLFGQVF